MKKSRKTRGMALTAFALAGLLTGGMMVQGAESSEGGGKYAFISKSMDNPYNFAMAEGFQEVIEGAGGECVVNHPLNAYADDQITLIDSLISQDVDAIAIAANDETRLTDALTEAREAGIQVITVDSDTDHSVRSTFCNQASTELIAQTMMDAVYDITGGEGQYAILSTTPYATNQNAWLEAMETLAASDEKYANLELIDIAYGEDQADASAEKTKDLLEEHPDLKAICALTSAGITAAAKTLSEEETEVKITGLGMPSELAEYIGEDGPCPKAYLWNPIDLGRLAAYTSMALVSGEITGAAGESVEADTLEGSPYAITELPEDSSATEIVLGSMDCFDAGNIDEWKDVF